MTTVAPCRDCGHSIKKHKTGPPEEDRNCFLSKCSCHNYIWPSAVQDYIDEGRKYNGDEVVVIPDDTPYESDYKSTQLEKRCTECGHRKLAHLDTTYVGDVGGCHHGSGCYCQGYTEAKSFADRTVYDESTLTASPVDLFHDGAPVFSDVKVEKVNDPVNHPAHYNGNGPEVIELIRWLSMNRGTAIKYIARAGKKDPTKEIEDIEKAIWYLNDELKILRGEVS